MVENPFKLSKKYLFKCVFFTIPIIYVPLDKCVRFHHHLPYKWQILQKDGITWGDLPNEEEIEKAYCSPANVLWYNRYS